MLLSRYVRFCVVGNPHNEQRTEVAFGALCLIGRGCDQCAASYASTI